MTRYPRTNRYNGGQARPLRDPSATPRNSGWKIRPASPKQLATIERCLTGDLQKVIAEGTVAKIAAMRDAGLTGEQASKWIDWLFKQPFANSKNGRTAPAERTERTDDEPVKVPGFYRLDERVYKVQESTRNPGRFFAKVVTAHGWDYEVGAIYKLTEAMWMTPEQIAEFGISSGVCANCSKTLDDPVSKHIGLGTKCGPSILGRPAYNEARKAAKLNPKVAEQLAAIEAGKVAAGDNWAEWKNEAAAREAEQERAAEEAKWAWKAGVES